MKNVISFKSIQTLALTSLVLACTVMPKANAAAFVGIGAELVAENRNAPVTWDDGVYGRSPLGKKMYKLALATFIVGAATGSNVLGLVFVLDEKLNAIAPISEEDLIDNGHSETIAKQIMQDAQAFNEILKKENKILQLSHQDNSASIREELEKIAPNLSEEFLDVYSERLTLMAQTIN
ncbi:MAG: hypothetical protein AB7I27_14365 [Bacteriovoracaceae bacterium]